MYPVHTLHPDGCHIGFGRVAVIPLVVYDTFFGLLQIALFASIMCRYIRDGPTKHPRTDAQTSILRKTLKVAFVGSFVAFMLSFFNIMTLVIDSDLHADVCLFLCIIDVIGNACVITYLTRPVTPAVVPSRQEPPNASNLVGKTSIIDNVSSGEEEYDHELQTVAEMLKQMQNQARQIDPTTSNATVSPDEPSSVGDRLIACTSKPI